MEALLGSRVKLAAEAVSSDIKVKPRESNLVLSLAVSCWCEKASLEMENEEETEKRKTFLWKNPNES
jgi:hypothetical protein